MSSENQETTTQRLATVRERLSQGMDRREFLRTVAGAGYGLGMASLLGVEDFLTAGRGSVPIVTALSRPAPDEPGLLEEQTKEVPVEWYTTVTKAFEIHRLLAETGVPGYVGSSVQPHSHRMATAPIVINVSPEDLDRARAYLETLIQEVPFTIEAAEDVTEEIEAETFERSPNLARGDGREVAGGVRCENRYGRATLAPAIYDPAVDRSFFATASHAYDDAPESLDQPLFLPHATNHRARIGAVQRNYPAEDVALIEPDPSVEPERAIQAHDGATTRVSGQLTRMGLADLAAREESLEKMAAQTGHTTGTIQGIDAVTCYTDDVCRHGQLKWGQEQDFTDGDSGSVSYYPDPDATDDAVLVASFNNARTWWPGQSYIWGVAAYYLYEQHGYHF